MKNLDLTKLGETELSALITECRQELQFRHPVQAGVFEVRIGSNGAKFPATPKQFDYCATLAEKRPGSQILISKDQATLCMFKADMSKAIELLKEGKPVIIKAA